MAAEVYSVGALTTHIRELIETSFTLQDTWVEGEISNMRVANSGHWYFTLKDNRAALKCVMWRSDAARYGQAPRDGDAVRAHGRIGVYEQRGEYQLYADFIRPVGVGDLYQQFELLKSRLQAEGLFDEEHKRPLPTFPARIGVVTSADAAAYQDVLNVLRRRFPVAEVVLSPTLVQGDTAPPQIVLALGRLADVDVIILCRGGGSIEDLWAFNDEAVARAVFESMVPVVTGVGHETDFTIVDFVADLRAPTPSAAAEVATPDAAELREQLHDRQRGLVDAAKAQLRAFRDDTADYVRTLGYLSPARTIERERQRVDDLAGRLGSAQHRSMDLRAERLSTRMAALNAANPAAILARGYAIVTRSEDGTIVRNEKDAKPGVGVTIRLESGELKARIEDKDTHEQYKRTLFCRPRGDELRNCLHRTRYHRYSVRERRPAARGVGSAIRARAGPRQALPGVARCCGVAHHGIGRLGITWEKRFIYPNFYPKYNPNYRFNCAMTIFDNARASSRRRAYAAPKNTAAPTPPPTKLTTNGACVGRDP